MILIGVYLHGILLLSKFDGWGDMNAQHDGTIDSYQPLLIMI